MRIAIYPGNFDPFTNGHRSILERACRLFDVVIVAVACDNKEKTLFTPEERALLIHDAIQDMPGVQVEIFEGLLVNYVCEKKAQAIIRGLRMISDFEFELQMAAFNQNLCPSVETIFLTSRPDSSYINSVFIKSIAALNGNIDGFVPQNVAIALRKKYKK